LPEKTKWFLGEKEIEPTKTYVRKSSFHGLSKIDYFDISDDAVLVINVNQSVIEAVRNTKLLKLQINMINCVVYPFENNFDKELAGSYKAKFYSSDGENSATFTVKAGNAPEFHDKPHIVQRDGGNIIVIKVRAKSHLDMTAEWFKDDKPLKATDRIKIVAKKDDKDKEGFQFLLEIHGPVKEDQAKYKCVVKNSEGQNEQSLNLCFD
uniref:Ig-like domain-containing protein n=1 Tax=Brugia timori TaxID=42155 RepID=A0A0R3Q995_9BILA